MYMYMYMYMYTIGQAEVKLWEKNDWYIELFHFSGLCNMFECLFLTLEKEEEEGPRPAILLEIPNWNSY